MVSPHTVLPRPQPARPLHPAERPVPVLRHGSSPAQRELPLRRAA